MKKIKDIRDLELEETKLKLKAELLTKEIGQTWRSIKSSLNPINMAGEFISEKLEKGKEVADGAKLLLEIGKRIFSQKKQD